MNLRGTRWVDGILVVMVLIWGVNYSVIKRAFAEIPPQPYNAIRMLIATAVFFVAMAWAARTARSGRKISRIFYTAARPTTSDKWRIFALGIIGQFVYQICFVGGVNGTVKELGLFGTTLVMPDNVIATVGNNKVLSETIVNFSQLPLRRVDATAKVANGVDVNRAIVMTFAIGAAMAGAAGVLYGLIFRQVYFFTGFVPGIKAFTAAVLGGVGNIPGAMLGGIFLGQVEGVGPTLFLDGLGVPSPNQLRDVIAFTMLVLVLIFRPSGILGERVSQRA